MTPAQFQKVWEQKINQIKSYARNTLPRHIGKIAVDHYHENFQKGGFVDENLEPWIPSKRIGKGKDAGSQYGTLLSARKELYNSITDTPAENSVKISSDKPYSRIHNEGGQISQNVNITPKMRRFAWAMHYKENPDSKEAFSAWKGLAITKKQTISRTFTIPKRKFMGRSIALNRKIQERIQKDVKQILLSK